MFVLVRAPPLPPPSAVRSTECSTWGNPWWPQFGVCDGVLRWDCNVTCVSPSAPMCLQSHSGDPPPLPPHSQYSLQNSLELI